MYKIVKSLFKVNLELCFNQVDMLGLENLPEQGPVIICSNHSNQFIDGVLLVSKLPRQIHFIGAAKSVRRPIIGDLMKALGVIPVERAQDIAHKGKGLIIAIQNHILKGKNTQFTKLKQGDSISISTLKQSFIVEDVLDDLQVKVKSIGQEDIAQLESEYKITPKIDYSTMYENVYSALKKDQVIGIFPEGGSHDRTELLPLKAGVCIMALGAMANYNVNVKIVTLGLNYYRADQLQSKAFAIINKPLEIEQDLVQLYKVDKKQAIQKLLTQIEKKMKESMIIAKDYEHLKAIYTIRRLYTTGLKNVTSEQKIKLNQRISLAFQKVENLEPDQQKFLDSVVKYNKILSKFNIIDKNLEYLTTKSYVIDGLLFGYYFCSMIFFSTLILPNQIFVGPMQLYLNNLAEKERVKALKSSSVKIEGRDVVSSYKMTSSFWVFPLFGLIYSSMIFMGLKQYSTLNTKECAQSAGTFLILWPINIYVTYKLQYVLYQLYRNLKSKFYFIFYRNEFKSLFSLRKCLEQKVKQIVNKYYDTVFKDEDRIIEPSNKAKYQKRNSYHIEQAFETLEKDLN